MKKRVLILGPIGDVGGRDVEVNIIARSLAENYDVRIFSTGYITENSFAITGLKDVSFSSLQRELFSKSLVMRVFGFLKYLSAGKKEKAYSYIKNRFSRAIFNFRNQELVVLKSEIERADVVIACVQLTTTYLTETAEFAKEKNIPLIVRTTGTIREIAPKYFGFLKKITHFIHHSQANAENLNRQIALPYSVIDQCALSEESLLEIPVASGSTVTFGFIGRFSHEKGVLPMAEYFTKHPELQLLIAGDGPQKPELLSMIAGHQNITFIGHLQSSEIHSFFEKIDCLVIPSREESGPLVGLEAMAAGKLIASTNVGAMAGRLLHTGNDFWFDIDDIDSLGRCIGEILSLSPPAWTQISSAVRSKYLSEYTGESIRNQYLDLLKTFVDESRH
ncbi:MAG: glycosyltransferase [Flavobacterium sp.]|nr:MAG: glycosyltransferase [Flavobacterium sp.]